MHNIVFGDGVEETSTDVGGFVNADQTTLPRGLGRCTFPGQPGGESLPGFVEGGAGLPPYGPLKGMAEPALLEEGVDGVRCVDALA